MFPLQKISDSKKNAEWFKQCHDYFENAVLFGNNNSASSFKNRAIKNRNLFTYDTATKQDIANIIDPWELGAQDIPNNFKIYPIANPHIMKLMGEELKKRFDWGIVVTSRDAIKDKTEQRKSHIDQFTIQTITAKYEKEEDAQAEIEDFMEDLHTWQDLREIGMTELLTYYWENLNLKELFNTAWENQLIECKAVVDVDEYNNIPSIIVFDPANVYAYGNYNSEIKDELEALVMVEYIPVSTVVDRYYNYLKPEQIDELEKRAGGGIDNSFNISPVHAYQQVITPTNGIVFDKVDMIDISNSSNLGETFDSQGNIRVIKTRWIGRREVIQLTSLDEEGNENVTFVHPDYKHDITRGETIKRLWINEAYESTKVLDFYLKQQVRDIQYRKLDNISYCNLGVVIIEYEKGLFDIMKPYIIDFSTYMWKLEEAFKKTLGSIGLLDTAMIPEGMDVKTVMYYASKMGWLITDSFKEGKKGRATGKLAGDMSGQQRNINIEQYQLIQQCFVKLQFIENQLNKIVGISPERMGLTRPDAGLGVTQEALQASSDITEFYFYKHEQFKLKVLRLLGEVAKFCVRNGSETLQYVASNNTVRTFTIDGPMINEADYNVLTLQSNIDAKTETMLQTAIQSGIQTGKVSMEQMVAIYSNDSIASIKRKIVKIEKQNQKIQQQQQQAQQESSERMMQMQLADKQADRDLAKYKIDTEAATKLATSEMAVYNRREDIDLNDDSIVDPAQIHANALKQQDLLMKSFDKQKELSIKDKEVNQRNTIANKTLALKDREIKSKEKIEALKAETALKIALENKNKYD